MHGIQISMVLHNDHSKEQAAFLEGMSEAQPLSGSAQYSNKAGITHSQIYGMHCTSVSNHVQSKVILNGEQDMQSQ
jgi:hypothetical protein